MGARVSDRIGAIAESATLAVDAKAKALKAAGRPVIGFGAGEPDFPTPEPIVAAAAEACRDPRNRARRHVCVTARELCPTVAHKSTVESETEPKRGSDVLDTDDPGRRDSQLVDKVGLRIDPLGRLGE